MKFGLWLESVFAYLLLSAALLAAAAAALSLSLPSSCCCYLTPCLTRESKPYSCSSFSQLQRAPRNWGPLGALETPRAQDPFHKDSALRDLGSNKWLAQQLHEYVQRKEHEARKVRGAAGFAAVANTAAAAADASCLFSAPLLLLLLRAILLLIGSYSCLFSMSSSLSFALSATLPF